MKRIVLVALLAALASTDLKGQDIGHSFRNPPDTARPWVYWFWMNGNISREGMTKDLESMKQVGVGGVLWMEVSTVREITVRFSRGVSFQLAVDTGIASWKLTRLISRAVLSGPWCAPQGPIEAGSKQWHEALQWAISEADRLGMAFGLSVDFGYRHLPEGF